MLEGEQGKGAVAEEGELRAVVEAGQRPMEAAALVWGHQGRGRGVLRLPGLWAHHEEGSGGMEGSWREGRA